MYVSKWNRPVVTDTSDIVCLYLSHPNLRSCDVIAAMWRRVLGCSRWVFAIREDRGRAHGTPNVGWAVAVRRDLATGGIVASAGHAFESAV